MHREEVTCSRQDNKSEEEAYIELRSPNSKVGTWGLQDCITSSEQHNENSEADNYLSEKCCSALYFCSSPINGR